MKIGVLQCGLVHEKLTPEHGEYDVIFERWLGADAGDMTFQGYVVEHGETPDDPRAADAWILSGSKYGVYEDHDWIEPLKAFIRKCAAARVPMIGVCFGHQIMAEALGGRAEKSAKGWGLGRSEYDVAARPGWMKDAPDRIAINAVHQDQVTVQPPETTVLARSPFCEYAALAYGDPEAPWAISIQPHPEFSDRFVEQLIDLRRGTAFPVADSDDALARSGGALDRDWARGWVRDFLVVSPKS